MKLIGLLFAALIAAAPQQHVARLANWTDFECAQPDCPDVWQMKGVNT
jgi:hypothetical protein